MFCEIFKLFDIVNQLLMHVYIYILVLSHLIFLNINILFAQRDRNGRRKRHILVRIEEFCCS